MTTVSARVEAVIEDLKTARVELASDTDKVSAIASSMVQLSYFAYNEPIDQIAIDVANPDMVFPAVPDSYWRCVWGPVTDPEKGNLLYGAGLFAGSPDDAVQPSPFLVAVVSRGTADPDTTGLLKDLYEDATPVPQCQWLDVPNAWIAAGSLDALTTVTALRWNGETMLEYLSALPEQDGYEPIILVTGHSLGGCIASMLAPWLAARLPQAKTAWLTPITFAGPTAGTQGFVDSLIDACPLRQIYVNPMDVVPRAWWDITSIPDIYGWKYFDPVVETWALTTAGLLEVLDDPYVPVPSPIPALPGIFIDLGDPHLGIEWFQEALAQHSCANYMLLMGLPAPYAFSPGAHPLQRLEESQRSAPSQGQGAGQRWQTPRS